MENILLITLLLFAYLLGSVSSAILVCKAMRLPDPRREGSQNPGATNVLRIGGKGAAAITLLGDALKGAIPVWIAQCFHLSFVAQSLVIAAALIGHLFPIFFEFKGGKGVATFIGGLCAFSWPVALCWGGVWLIIAAIFRYSSLAALIASALTPLCVLYFTKDATASLIFAVICVLIFYRHHNNILHLMRGTEKKIGKKA